MVGVKIDPLLEQAIALDLCAGISLRKAAAKHGVCTSVVARIRKGVHVKPKLEDGPKEWTQEGEKATCEFTSAELVRSEADAMRLAGVDANRWRVAKMRIKTYQTAMKMKTGKDKPDEEKIVQLYAIRLDLELILPEPYLDATEALFRRLEEQAPIFDFPPLISPQSDSHVLVINLFDCHFGKLCWAPETGDNYDLRIAEAVFGNAVDDLLRLTAGFPVERIVFAIGNDLHHVDTLSRTTTAGTPQDCDVRYFKMVDIVESSVLRALKKMADRANVDAFYLGGNHDRIASWHLCRTVAATFANATDRISVDVSPRVRKYRRYGVNLFGFTHGHQVKEPRSLVNLMAIESPEEWARTTYRAWFLGHLHTSKSSVTQHSHEFNGVEIHWGPSPAGTDAYHFEEGYVGNRKAAEAYLCSMESGFVGKFVAQARF